MILERGHDDGDNHGSHAHRGLTNRIEGEWRERGIHSLESVEGGFTDQTEPGSGGRRSSGRAHVFLVLPAERDEDRDS